MSEYITLIGAEQVVNAGHNMSGAADRMNMAANSFWETADRLTRAMENHAVQMGRVAERIEAAMNGSKP